MDEGVAEFLFQLQGLVVSVVIDAFHQADLGAVGLGCLDLGDGGGVRQADQGRDAALGSGQGHALSVVSGGAGDNAFGFFLIGKHSDFVSGTPELERAGVLQIFRLQVQLAFRGDAVCLGQGGGADDILQHQRGVEQFVDRDHMVFLSFQNGSKKPCLFHKL